MWARSLLSNPIPHECMSLTCGELGKLSGPDIVAKRWVAVFLRIQWQVGLSRLYTHGDTPSRYFAPGSSQPSKYEGGLSVQNLGLARRDGRWGCRSKNSLITTKRREVGACTNLAPHCVI